MANFALRSDIESLLERLRRDEFDAVRHRDRAADRGDWNGANAYEGILFLLRKEIDHLEKVLISLLYADKDSVIDG